MTCWACHRDGTWPDVVAVALRETPRRAAFHLHRAVCLPPLAEAVVVLEGPDFCPACGRELAGVVPWMTGRGDRAAVTCGQACALAVL